MVSIQSFWVLSAREMCMCLDSHRRKSFLIAGGENEKIAIGKGNEQTEK